MSLWVGFLAFLKFFIPSFMRTQSRLDEKSTKCGYKQDSKETPIVSDRSTTNTDISRSAPCRPNDSAYDTLHTSFSPNRSVDQGCKSDLSDLKSVDNLSNHPRYPANSTVNEQNACFSPVNKLCIDDSSDHVTYSTSQKLWRNEYRSIS